LPIALSKAGTPPRELAFGVMPSYFNLTALRPSDHLYFRPPDLPGFERKTWDELSAACEKLEVLEFSPQMRYFNAKHDNNVQMSLDRYLGSVLSRCGHHLRVLSLDFSNKDRDVFPNPRERRLYTASPLIRALPERLPRLRSLQISGVELRQAELEALFSRAAENRLSDLRVLRVRLRDGIWAGAVDLMREKVFVAEHREHGRVCLNELLGGEFPDANLSEREPYVWSEFLSLGPRRGMPAPPIIAKILRYVERLRETNPLREERLTITTADVEDSTQE
jgi:hypothetical protein